MITLAQALTSGVGTEREFNCPVHHDTRPSASVNVVKGLWVCYTCRASGTVDGVIWDGIDVSSVSETVRGMLDIGADRYPESWLDQFDAAGPGSYWLTRFEPATARAFRLGHDAIRDAATYPLREPSGALLGVVRRPMAQGRTKYRYPHGVHTSKLLFNYVCEQTDVVVLTEGASDTIAATEAGLPEGWRALACFSAHLSKAQVHLLERLAPATVVLAYDQDEAGNEASIAAWAALDGFSARIVRARWHGGKDLAELGPDLRRDVLMQAVAL